MLTMRPYLACCIPGSAAAVQLRTPPRLTAMTRAHCSGVVVGKKPNSSMPALLTRMSSVPVAATAACAAARSVTSSSTAWPLTSAAIFSAPATSMSPTQTSAPSAARRAAIAAPMPLAPPVTRAFLPSSLTPGSIDWRAMDVPSEPIPIIGGTGALGAGLARRWARAGAAVVLGSRSAERAEEAAAKIREAVPGADVTGLPNEEAAGKAEIVFLTVPFRAQSENLNNLREALRPGQILVDCTVPLAAAVSGKATRTLGVWQGSAAQQAQEMVPDGVTVVAALHTVGAPTL